MTFYLMLRGEGDTTTDHDYQDYFRCYPGDQNKELLFLSWDVTKKKISYPPFPFSAQVPDWCFISYFSYVYGTMLTVFIRKWPAG